MSREKINYDRISATKSPAIIYLAVEGQKTEVQYFQQLNSEIHDSRFRLSIVPKSDDSYSAPMHVLETMKKHKASQKQASPIDQFWIVIDRDRWPKSQLHEVMITATSLKISIAFSNPCFELWLIFHFIALNCHDQLKQLNDKRKQKEKLVTALRSQLGSFNPNNIKLDNFLPHTRTAIENAMAVTPETPACFEELGSSVFRLFSEIRDSLKIKI